jgi:hypothetical protein
VQMTMSELDAERRRLAMLHDPRYVQQITKQITISKDLSATSRALSYWVFYLSDDGEM